MDTATAMLPAIPCMQLQRVEEAHEQELAQCKAELEDTGKQLDETVKMCVGVGVWREILAFATVWA